MSLQEEVETAAHDADCPCSMCRIRRGAARGGTVAAARRRERRRRYDAGTMSTSERAAYVRDVLGKARAAGRKGGLASRRRAQQLSQAEAAVLCVPYDHDHDQRAGSQAALDDADTAQAVDDAPAPDAL